MILNISEDEIQWLKRFYPDLNFVLGTPSVIKGLFKFDAIYDSLRVKDSYKIEITLSDRPPSILPKVKETGGRIKMSKERYKKNSFADVHLYTDDSSCLCAYPEEKIKLPNGFNLKDFFEHLLIPHFYAQSRFEQTGKWVWGDRSHGTLGLLESYLEFRDKDNLILIKEYIKDLRTINDSDPFVKLFFRKDQIRGHIRCFCGSNKEFRNCHKSAFHGFWNLKEDFRNSGIKLSDVI